jgi:hypothetical protein
MKQPNIQNVKVTRIEPLQPGAMRDNGTSDASVGIQSNYLTDSRQPSTEGARSDDSLKSHQFDELGKIILDYEYEEGSRPFSGTLPDPDYSVENKKMDNVRSWANKVRQDEKNKHPLDSEREV